MVDKMIADHNARRGLLAELADDLDRRGRAETAPTPFLRRGAG
jgi:hypothetical protein